MLQAVSQKPLERGRVRAGRAGGARQAMRADIVVRFFVAGLFACAGVIRERVPKGSEITRNEPKAR